MELQSAFDDAFKAYNECNEEIKAVKERIAVLENQLSESENIVAEDKSEQREMLIHEKDLFNEQLTQICTRISTNSECEKNIGSRYEDLLKVEQKLTMVKTLSDTANGNVSGKEKIMLETYIQMTYFDRIIDRANMRFMMMSDGQYELVRRKEAGNKIAQSGLELDIIDHYNGTQRSVKTLSGGESFKASLSLALGLSDEMQSIAGGIRLDSMFVDEGFGSLDEESLRQAIKTLDSLTEGNRLVGIISHVAELKERIDKQIVVRKGKPGEGSSVEIIV